MNKKLTDIGNAAQLLNDMLSDPMVKAFLELEGKFEIDKEFVGFRSALPLIAARAYRAATSPAISNKAGKAKSGRGKALFPGAYNPKIFCALVIAEAWERINHDYPPPANVTAAKAAEAYWLASGGSKSGLGNDRLLSWRPYFQKARTPQFADQRAECRRILGAVVSIPHLSSCN